MEIYFYNVGSFQKLFWLIIILTTVWQSDWFSIFFYYWDVSPIFCPTGNAALTGAFSRRFLFFVWCCVGGSADFGFPRIFRQKGFSENQVLEFIYNTGYRREKYGEWRKLLNDVIRKFNVVWKSKAMAEILNLFLRINHSNVNSVWF